MSALWTLVGAAFLSLVSVGFWAALAAGLGFPVDRRAMLACCAVAFAVCFALLSLMRRR